MATSFAGAAVFVFRGCWHRKMSWPIRVEGYSYQVCLGCGIKRLFDENTFHGFGPYSYDLHHLIARDRAARMKALRREGLVAMQTPQGARRDWLASAFSSASASRGRS